MKVLLEKIDDVVEEEVTLLVGNQKLVCFAGTCPYQIEVGRYYQVDFDMKVFDDYSVVLSNLKKSSLTRLGDTFSYIINGKLQGNSIDCVIPFEDNVLLSAFGYLDGEFVEFKVDRIDVNFL